MKTRNDFVTNSSSSSFVIAFKGNDARKNLEDVLKLSDNYPLKSIISELIDYLARECRYNLKTSKEEFINEKIHNGYYTEDEINKYFKEILELFDDGFQISEFSVSNEDDNSWSNYLYNNTINIKTENFVMKGES